MRRISQSELADMVGVSQSYIAMLERPNILRNKSPRLVLLISISQALDICPNEILRFKCNSCHRFYICKRHEYFEEDDIYFKEHLDYYI